MRDLLERIAVGLIVFLIWVVAWTLTIYWTVRLVHTAWNAGVIR